LVFKLSVNAILLLKSFPSSAKAKSIATSGLWEAFSQDRERKNKIIMNKMRKVFFIFWECRRECLFGFVVLLGMDEKAFISGIKLPPHPCPAMHFAPLNLPQGRGESV
jgi:hypothetical protein